MGEKLIVTRSLDEAMKDAGKEIEPGSDRVLRDPKTRPWSLPTGFRESPPGSKVLAPNTRKYEFQYTNLHQEHPKPIVSAQIQPLLFQYLYLRMVPVGTGNTDVAGDKRGIQCLCQRQIDRIIGGHRVA
jgi:hypothetical protein